LTDETGDNRVGGSGGKENHAHDGKDQEDDREENEDELEGKEDGRNKGVGERTARKAIVKKALSSREQTREEVTPARENSSLPATMLTLSAGPGLLEAMMSSNGVEIEIKLSVRPRNANTED